MTEGIEQAREAIGRGPHRLQLGLRSLDPAAWIESIPDFEAQLHERARIVGTEEDVLAGAQAHHAEQWETLQLLARHLVTRFPARYRLDGVDLHVRPTGDRWRIEAPERLERPALEIIARIVPEDVCILVEDPSGQYRLVAAAVCFPTRWRLRPKMGQPLLAIHAPVPGYEQSIGAAVDQVFRALTVERPLWRQNWSLLDSPALHEPVRTPLGASAALTLENLGERLWLRSERQTMRRLERTRAVIFTIGIRQVTLGSVSEDPQIARRLREQIETMEPRLQRYKGVEASRELVLDYLSKRCG